MILIGKFRRPGQLVSKEKEDTSLADDVLRLDTEHITVVPNTAEGRKEVISDRDLDLMLDRNEEVFKERGVGWASKAVLAGSVAADAKMDKDMNRGGVKSGRTVAGGEDGKERVAFEVFEAQTEGTNAGLTKMFGEENGV
jgi:ATP-dependent DNA helicase